MTGDHRVVFTPSGLAGPVADGTTVLAAARLLGVDLDSVCGGRGLCGRCQIAPTFGSFPKWAIESGAGALAPPSELEQTYRGVRSIEPGNRLGCATPIRGDVVLDVPPASQIHKQVIRKELAADPFDVDPVIDLFFVEVPEPALGRTVSEMALILECLDLEWGRRGLSVDPRLLAGVHAVLRQSHRELTVVVHHGLCQVVALRPGYVDSVYGIAVDVGSTTIAGYLCDLDRGDIVASGGAMNPQIRFGEDLMSRVSHSMTSTGGAAELTGVVRVALDGLIGELVADAGLSRADVLDIVLVGNPIMHHLVLGIDPSPLGVAPFPLATADAVHTRADSLEINCPDASVYVLPCIGGHIGADAAAAVLASGLDRPGPPRLMVDVGTNAEIVLTDGNRLFAASSPTGPALEGAQISCGVRATAGAIERVRIDRATLEPRWKVIGCDLWSDDPAFAAAAAGLDMPGLCGSGIIETIGELFLAGILSADGAIRDRRAETSRVVADGRTFAYVLRSESDDDVRPGGELRFTQADVRAVQLAKAALRAGIDLLRERAAVDVVDQVALAGAFGSHIDPLYAMVLGLVPDGALESVVSIGNVAGAGAVASLLSRARRRDVEEVVATIERVETATEPRFLELFVAAMAIPHTDPTPMLASRVELPTSTDNADARSMSGRRRRQRTRRTKREEETSG